jgi:predicted amidohydrolase
MRSGTDQAANIEAMDAAVREAARRGATYVQTPEMTGLVQRGRDALTGAISPDAANPVFRRAASLARELGIHLHIGSTAVAAGNGKAHNRAALFSPRGKRIATYDKIHMFDVDLDNGESWRESAVYQPGDEALVVELAEARLGFAICYDLRFPQLYRAEALAGAEILTCPAAFTRQTGEAHWHVLLRARAIENGAFLIAAAQGGQHEDGRETYGHSVIIDPWGRVLAEADHDEPGVIVAEIDTEQSAAARRKIPNLRNARDFAGPTMAAQFRGAAS